MITVNIHDISKIAGEESREQKAAKKLKKMLEEEFSKRPNVEGTFHILTNPTFGGGQVSEIDVLLLCDLNNVDFELTDEVSSKKVNVIVQKMGFILELKNHNSFFLKGNQFYVEYDGVEHSVSAQSRQQKFDFGDYLKATLNDSPYLYNFIWFTSINGSAIDDTIRRGKDSTLKFDDNSLSNNFSFRKLLQKTMTIWPKSVWEDNYGNRWMNGFHDCANKKMIDSIVDHFIRRKTIVGDLTQKKLNLISMKAAKADLKDLKDNCFTEFKGRAGTGKTIKLIQRAIQLKNEGKGNRCLMLTYNQALVNDVKRLLYYAGETQKPGEKSVQIKTLHSFFLDLMVTLDVRKDKVIDYFSYFKKDGDYERELGVLLNKTIPSYSGSDIKYLKELEPKIDWDYILIDEAQDWLVAERDILFKVYGPERIIVANGVDQFSRPGSYLDWTEGISDINLKNDELSLRQKNNLSSFVNALANKYEIDWNVIPNEDFQGGQIFISDGYTPEFHQLLLEYGKSCKSEPYDILFLIPTQSEKNDHFEYYKEFKEDGIIVFDGTHSNNRDKFPILTDECRMYNYESCRGLEGWSVICYKFDLLIQNKKEEYLRKIKTGELKCENPMVSPDELATDFALLWSLIPLTRAIDTLVITLDNPQSEIGKMLYSLYREKDHKDYVHWVL